MRFDKMRLLYISLALLVSVTIAGYLLGPRERPGLSVGTYGSGGSGLSDEFELSGDQYYAMVDEANRTLLRTGMMLGVGNQFIAEDNKMYEVTSIEGLKARAKLVGTLNLSEFLSSGYQAAEADRQQGAKPSKASVAIYHTHSDESYVPSDGAASIPGRGGIYKVGSALKQSLVGRGLDTVQDMTSHDPHDAGAYERSRRTALNLLKQRPAVLFDVHRDAAPPEEYEKTVSSRRVTQVMMVLGKQNPKLQSNLDFAKRLKAYSDKSHPGLVKGILIANGRYNQDLYDKSLLLEFGAHTNYREEAQKATELMADAVKVAGAAAPSPPSAPTGSGTWRALAWIVVLAVIGGGAYLVIATGGWNNALEKLRQFTSKEFANFVGLGSREARTKGEKEWVQGQDQPENRTDDDITSGGTEEGIHYAPTEQNTDAFLNLGQDKAKPEDESEDASLGRS